MAPAFNRIKIMAHDLDSNSIVPVDRELVNAHLNYTVPPFTFTSSVRVLAPAINILSGSYKIKFSGSGYREFTLTSKPIKEVVEDTDVFEIVKTDVQKVWLWKP